MAQIEEIYHSHNGVDGYRSMSVYLTRKGYSYSPLTIHKYMNTEPGLRSIVRPKKPGYEHGKPHKVFENRLKQNFQADGINQKWCTDFTYLFLKNHGVRYNCTIIDLHDRSVVASITDRHITSDLAIRTLQKALDSQPVPKGELILHSDQGTQYTSKAFVEFCESMHVTQSMSKASALVYSISETAKLNGLRPYYYFTFSSFLHQNIPCTTTSTWDIPLHTYRELLISPTKFTTVRLFHIQFFYPQQIRNSTSFTPAKNLLPSVANTFRGRANAQFIGFLRLLSSILMSYVFRNQCRLHALYRQFIT